MSKAYLSLGSNQGDRLDYLKRAVRALAAEKANRIVALSSVYETDPVGYTDQPPFLNLVAGLETTLDPLALLGVCQGIENRLGRVHTKRWGPRTIDLDILLIDDCLIDGDDLIIPHPRMKERAFVLVPLAEVAPDLLVEGESVSRILERLQRENPQGVSFWKSTRGWVEA